MNIDSSPIAAIATAPGRGGIGVVRASGKNLQALIAALFGETALKPRHATYIPFTQADGGMIDQGIAIWFAGQAFINMGVNLGVLPTKGLTLPLMSYGGSAIVMNLVALAIVIRIDVENRQMMRGGRS